MQAIASALATLGLKNNKVRSVLSGILKSMVEGVSFSRDRERPLEPELHGNLMPAYSRHHAAEQTHRGDVLILHRWRALDPSACLRGQSWSRKSEQGDKWSFCLTAGTLCPANQERP